MDVTGDLYENWEERQYRDGARAREMGGLVLGRGIIDCLQASDRAGGRHGGPKRERAEWRVHGGCGSVS